MLQICFDAHDEVYVLAIQILNVGTTYLDELTSTFFKSSYFRNESAAFIYHATRDYSFTWFSDRECDACVIVVVI